MKKPTEKILVTQSSMPSIEEYFEEVKVIWETHWLTNMGEKHQLLEQQLCKYLEVTNTTLFVNGHQALECVLEAMDLKGEVITTPFTFASTTHAIVRKGLTPVFCDINCNDYTMDVSKIESLITPQTCAILPVHVYGNICDVTTIQKIADKYNLKIIYDAAHAFGVKKNGIGVANFGDASMFSFHATKVFNTIEGGAICFKNKMLKTALNQWKNFGITGPETVEYIGGNAKMNEFCAAMGLCNLRHVAEDIKKRKYVTERYLKNLWGIDGIQLNKIPQEIESNYAYFPVVFDEKILGCTRDNIFLALEKQGVGARKYFYPLTNAYQCYKYNPENTPVALGISKQILTLPLYAELTLENVDRICHIIKETLRVT